MVCLFQTKSRHQKLLKCTRGRNSNSQYWGFGKVSGPLDKLGDSSRERKHAIHTCIFPDTQYSYTHTLTRMHHSLIPIHTNS